MQLVCIDVLLANGEEPNLILNFLVHFFSSALWHLDENSQWFRILACSIFTSKHYRSRCRSGCNISKTSASVSSGFQTRENWWKHEAAGRVLFIVFECLKPRWNTKHEFLKFLLQQKKISLNYHFNKVSQFNYYIWDVKCAWCAWSYRLTAALWQFLNIHQLMSRCYLAVCQFWVNTLLRKANGRVQI